MDLPSKSLAPNRQYRDTVTCLPAHTEQGFAKVAEVRIICTQEWQYRDTAPTNTPTGIKKQSRTPNEPKMHDIDKTCFVFRTACLCPNSCATNDDRQMRRTDKDTPHAPKIMLTSIGPQQWTGNTPIKDRNHWPHPRSCENDPSHFVGPIHRFALAPLVDVVAGCVCAFCGTLFSSPALDLRPRLTGLISQQSQHRNTVRMPLRQGRRRPSARVVPICTSPSVSACSF